MDLLINIPHILVGFNMGEFLYSMFIIQLG